MADFTIVSPGVTTREFDLTIQPATPTGVGTALISPRVQGPAFQRVRVKDLDADVQMFGLPKSDGKDFGAYTARAYLRTSTNPLTQVRVLGMSDTGVTPGYSLGTSAPAGLYGIVASGSYAVALIQASGAVTLAGTLTSSAGQLAINIAGFGAVTASLNRGDATYIGKVLNTDPSQFSTQKHVLFAVYDYVNKTPASGGTGGVYAAVQVPASNLWQDDFLTASSTTVISQPFGSVEWNLFGVGMIPAGDASNTQVKVSILNIKKSPSPDQKPFGTFSLVVRKYDDNDRQQVILESFSNLNLNPDDPNYIARRIGDTYKVWNKSTKKFDEFGQYENKSNYIYILPSLDMKNGNIPEAALPWGFSGYKTLVSGAFSDKAPLPDVPLVTNAIYKGDFNSRTFWGVAVINNLSGALNFGVADRAKHLPKNATNASGGTGASFSLKYLTGAIQNVSGYAVGTRFTDLNIAALSTSLSYSAATPALTGNISLENIENTDLARFTLIVSDGFDGIDITKANPFDPSDMGTTTAYQTYAYRTAIDMLSNPDEIELKEFVAPGVWATNVVNYGITMAENRGDIFYLADLSGASVADVVGDAVSRTLDTNYAAAWYPWLKIRDDVNDKVVEVPPTVIIPAVLAYSDSISFPWFAPGGMTRGSLRRHGVVKAKEKLNKSDLDRLYDNRINPIKTFIDEGPVVWGQKTFQIAESALTRINVRRMLLAVRKLIAKKANQLVFEPNVANTWARFINSVQPDLERIQKNFGISAFKLIMDDSTNTADVIERNIMYGKIAIQPTRAAEFILLDFFITNNVAGFAE